MAETKRPRNTDIYLQKHMTYRCTSYCAVTILHVHGHVDHLPFILSLFLYV